MHGRPQIASRDELPRSTCLPHFQSIPLRTLAPTPSIMKRVERTTDEAAVTADEEEEEDEGVAMVALLGAGTVLRGGALQGAGLLAAPATCPPPTPEFESEDTTLVAEGRTIFLPDGRGGTACSAPATPTTIPRGGTPPEGGGATPTGGTTGRGTPEEEDPEPPSIAKFP